MYGEKDWRDLSTFKGFPLSFLVNKNSMEWSCWILENMEEKSMNFIPQFFPLIFKKKSMEKPIN